MNNELTVSKQFELYKLKAEVRGCIRVLELQDMLCSLLDYQFAKDHLVGQMLFDTLPKPLK